MSLKNNKTNKDALTFSEIILDRDDLKNYN